MIDKEPPSRSVEQMITNPVAVFPTREIGTDPEIIRDFAQGVESMGFMALLTYDHIVGTKEETGNNHYNYQDAFHEPFTLFSYISAVTNKIELMTGVVVLPQRETTLVAKQAAEVANLSKGRLHLGVGAGSNPEEFAILDSHYTSRGKRMEKQVTLLRELWNREMITHTETQEETLPYGINPRPNYEIPIWMGGWAPPVLERTARIADGWMPMGHPEDIEPRIVHFRKLLEENDRDPDSFRILGSFGRRYSLDGGQKRPMLSLDNLDEWDDIFQRLQAIHLSDVAFSTMRFGLQGIDEHLKLLEKWKKEFDSHQPQAVEYG